MPDQTNFSAPEGPDTESLIASLNVILGNLGRAQEKRRTSVEAVPQVIAALRERLRAATAELTRIADENHRLSMELEAMHRKHAALNADHRRLYDGFVSLLEAVERHCSAQIGMDTRIEAAILSTDIGMNFAQDPPEIGSTVVIAEDHLDRRQDYERYE